MLSQDSNLLKFEKFGKFLCWPLRKSHHVRWNHDSNFCHTYICTELRYGLFIILDIRFIGIKKFFTTARCTVSLHVGLFVGVHIISVCTDAWFVICNYFTIATLICLHYWNCPSFVCFFICVCLKWNSSTIRSKVQPFVNLFFINLLSLFWLFSMSPLLNLLFFQFLI